MMQIKTICSRVTGILILIGSLGCLYKVKIMDMILGKCKFPNSFYLIFSNICCSYTIPTTYVFSIYEFFTISFFLNQINAQPLSFIQRKEHVEMNNFLCSLSCTWMKIIDCLFHASGSLS